MLTGRSAGLCGGAYDSGQGGNEYKACGSAARSEKTDDSSGKRPFSRTDILSRTDKTVTIEMNHMIRSIEEVGKGSVK